MKWIAGILIAVSFSGAARAQANPAWQNEGESYLGLAAQKEGDPAKQLDLLKQWEQQYPNSALKNQRILLTANALLNIVGAAFAGPTSASLEAGQKAAQQLIAGFTTYFDSSVKPAGASEAQWSSAKLAAELQARALLAQIAVSKKDDAEAEAQYKKILAMDPTQAATSFLLGGAILRQMAKSGNVVPGRYSEALYDLARSLAVTGANALPAAGQTAAMNSLKKNYINYHGDTTGLDDLIKQASASALPPGDFQILSVIQVSAIQAKEHANWARQHPELDFWQIIKAALESQGDAYFASSLQDVSLPPPAGDAYSGGPMFSATVVSVPSAKELLVNVDNPAGDARLKFDQDIKGDIPPGTALQFRGVVDSWSASPCVLVFRIQEPKTDISGLPDTVSFVPDRVKPPVRAPKPPAR